MRVVTTAVGLAMSAVVVAGCTPGDAPEATVDLTQQVYVAAAIGDTVPDAAVLAWARFEPGGRVVGWDGCNSQWGIYTGGRLDQVGHTDAACPRGRSPRLWDAGVVEVSDGGNTVVIPGVDGARHEFRALIDSAPAVSLAGAWALSGERVLDLRDDGTAAVVACGLEGTWSEGEQVVIDLPVVSANECLPDTALFDGTPLVPVDVVGTSGAILRRLDLPLEGPHAVQLARRVASPAPELASSTTQAASAGVSVEAIGNDWWVWLGEPAFWSDTAIVPMVRFQDGRWSGFDGCNWFGGEAAIAAGVLTIGETERTASDCDTAAPALAAASGPVALSVDGATLTLTTATGQAELHRLSPTERDLTETNWWLGPLWNVVFLADGTLFDEGCGPVGTWAGGEGLSVTLAAPLSCGLVLHREPEILDGRPLAAAVVGDTVVLYDDGASLAVALRPGAGAPRVVGLRSDGVRVAIDAAGCTARRVAADAPVIDLGEACAAVGPAGERARVVHDVLAINAPVGDGQWVWDLRPGAGQSLLSTPDGLEPDAVTWIPGGSFESSGDDVVAVPAATHPGMEAEWGTHGSLVAVSSGGMRWEMVVPDGLTAVAYGDHRALPDGSVALVVGFQGPEHFEDGIVVCATVCELVYRLDHLARFVALGDTSAFVLGPVDSDLTEVVYPQ